MTFVDQINKKIYPFKMNETIMRSTSVIKLGRLQPMHSAGLGLRYRDDRAEVDTEDKHGGKED